MRWKFLSIRRKRGALLPTPVARTPRSRSKRHHQRLFFAGSIVPRQKRFFLLIDDEAKQAAKVSDGLIVRVALEPYAE